MGLGAFRSRQKAVKELSAPASTGLRSTKLRASTLRSLKIVDDKHVFAAKQAKLPLIAIGPLLVEALDLHRPPRKVSTWIGHKIGQKNSDNQAASVRNAPAYHGAAEVILALRECPNDKSS